MRSEIGQALGPRNKRLLWTTGMLAVSAPIAVGVFSARAASAQQPTTALRFEVASIRPNPTGPSGPTEVRVLPGGRYVATNIPVRLLIGRVYTVPSVRLLGGPNWIESEYFDIDGKLDAETSAAVGGSGRPIEMALRTLLSERFKLVVHTETRQLPVYHLMPARGDGRLGPNLTPSTRTDCEARLAAQAGRVSGPPPPPPAAGGQAPPCGIRSLVGQFWVDSVPLSSVANLLTGEVERVVVDKTGLTGRFNAHISWTPFQGADGPDNTSAADRNGASLFAAVREQLGLKLESAIGPVEVLVIDSIGRPTPN